LLVSQENYATREGRHRTAIVVTNNEIDSLLLRQLSDEDTVVLEVLSDKAKTIVASMYFDIKNKLKTTCTKLKQLYNTRKELEFSWLLTVTLGPRCGTTTRPMQEEKSSKNF